MAEEKEVKGIVSKLMEARHSKSLDSYELLAQFCSRESITSLVLPLKEASSPPLWDGTPPRPPSVLLTALFSPLIRFWRRPPV